MHSPISSSGTSSQRKRIHPAGEKGRLRVSGSIPPGAKPSSYTPVDGQRRSLNLGEYYDPKTKRGSQERSGHPAGGAGTFTTPKRRKVKDLKNGRASGADPVELRGSRVSRENLLQIERKRIPTIAKFIEEYIEGHAKIKKRSWRTDEKGIEERYPPRLITAQDLTSSAGSTPSSMRDGWKRGAPVQANRLLAYVRKMFSYAVARDVEFENSRGALCRPMKSAFQFHWPTDNAPCCSRFPAHPFSGKD